MRIVFMGSPAFAVPTLDALVAAGHEIACVYSQPPRPAGRGKALRPTAVAVRAAEYGFEVRTPARLRGEDEQADFAALNADVAVVAAYGLILPQPILDAPRLGCLNVHASLLPRWRGAAPVQRAIMAGDEATGVCIMQMEAGLDTGPVRHCEELPIGDSDAAQLTERLSLLGARLMVEVLSDPRRFPPRAQPADGVTTAAKISKEEARIDWTRPAVEVQRQIQGLAPFPGAWFALGDERIKVHAAALAEGEGTPGTLLDGALTVACGAGAVRLLKLQRSGKQAMQASEILRGFPIAAGAVLS